MSKPFLSQILAMTILVAALPACKKATPTSASDTTNQSSPNGSPTAGTISVSPDVTGLASATNFRFRATGASDPEGESLIYSWSFGDGSTASGENASHVFALAGTFTVTLTVSDGRSSNTITEQVTVRDLTGRWRASSGLGVEFLDLRQDARDILGTYSNIEVIGNVTGHVESPRQAVLSINVPPSTDDVVVEGALDRLIEELTFQEGIVFVRQ